MKRRPTAQSAPSRRSLGESGFLNLRASITVLLCAATACSVLSVTLLAFSPQQKSSKVSHRTLAFAERVAYQRAIEEVYWRHRIWPEERRDPKPSLDAVMSRAQLESKVAGYLRDLQALEDSWQKPITAEQLQAELDRMARDTKKPEVLRELFDALENDAFLTAECLARPILAERLLNELNAHDVRFNGALKQSWLTKAGTQVPVTMAAVSANYTLPVIASPSGNCTNNTWTATSTSNAPTARSGHTAVWTGSEMIVWAGTDLSGFNVNTGGRYNPVTDTWTATSTSNAPTARSGHTAVWTGGEMIVWGGRMDCCTALNTGGRYNPATNTWTATSTSNAPTARTVHTAVWTGSEMIVWGGGASGTFFNTGRRYNPTTNSWTATSTINAPAGRYLHTAVWTGSEMVVWGGYDGTSVLNTGGRYHPTTNSWTATTMTNAPDARFVHTAVWTGSEMIVWGGTDQFTWFDTGGRYNPGMDSWVTTSTANAPFERDSHTAVWTGSEMIIWGGFFLHVNPPYPIEGGRYNPNTNTWTLTSVDFPAPSGRASHAAVWTGTEMIIWGGYNGMILNTGGRYCAQSGPTPTPTPTPTATATATPTPTPTPTPCTGRCAPTPRPRPTPAPRP